MRSFSEETGPQDRRVWRYKSMAALQRIVDSLLEELMVLVLVLYNDVRVN